MDTLGGARRPGLEERGRILYLSSVVGNPNPVKGRVVRRGDAGQEFSRHGEAGEESYSSVSGSWGAARQLRRQSS